MDNSLIESFKLDLFKQINKYRNNHGASNLKNEPKIDKIAQKFAAQLAKKGKLDYSYNQYNGEDLGESVYKSESYFAPLKLAKTLYDENDEYNYKSNDPEPSNFTQMVWRGSQLIGFGMEKSSNGKYYYVINYYPTGNVDGQFKKNVMPPGTEVMNTSKKSNLNNDDNNNKKTGKNESNSKKEYTNNSKNIGIKNEYGKKYDEAFFNDDNYFKKFGQEREYEYEKIVEKENDYKETKREKDREKEKEKDKRDAKLNTILNKLINNKKKETPSVNIKEKIVIEYTSSQIESTADYSDFCLEALDAHNHYRKIHHVQPLKLNKDLCNIAQNYSKKLGNEIGHLEHSENCYDGDTLGENLFFCYGTEPTGTSVSKNWYGEHKKHDYDGDWRSGTGHFTQMIWKESKEVGFGKYKNKKGQYYVVGNYYPAGNVIGFFKYNVFKP